MLPLLIVVDLTNFSFSISITQNDLYKSLFSTNSNGVVANMPKFCRNNCFLKGKNK